MNKPTIEEVFLSPYTSFCAFDQDNGFKITKKVMELKNEIDAALPGMTWHAINSLRSLLEDKLYYDPDQEWRDQRDQKEKS